MSAPTDDQLAALASALVPRLDHLAELDKRIPEDEPELKSWQKRRCAYCGSVLKRSAAAARRA